MAPTIQQAKKVIPAGDTARKTADAINQHAELITFGQLQHRTVSQLASEDLVAGRMFYCTNETGGAVPVFCDGTNWRRVTDRAVAS